MKKSHSVYNCGIFLQLILAKLTGQCLAKHYNYMGLQGMNANEFQCIIYSKQMPIKSGPFNHKYLSSIILL